MEDKSDMKKKGAAVAALESDNEKETLSGEVLDDEEAGLIIALSKPYFFEGKEYKEIDLSGLEDLTAADMIATNKYLDRKSAGINVMPEVSLEYACVLASKAAGMPVEFFTNLPPKYAMRVKNRVMAFLFGSE